MCVWSSECNEYSWLRASATTEHNGMSTGQKVTGAGAGIFLLSSCRSNRGYASERKLLQNRYKAQKCLEMQVMRLSPDCACPSHDRVSYNFFLTLSQQEWTTAAMPFCEQLQHRQDQAQANTSRVSHITYFMSSSKFLVFLLSHEQWEDVRAELKKLLYSSHPPIILANNMSELE